MGATLKQMAMDKEQLEAIVTSVLIDQPVGIQVRQYHFNLYPKTLGKMYVTATLMKSLDIDKKMVAIDPFLEIMHIVSVKRDMCCRLLAYHTLQTKEEILDNSNVTARQELLVKILDNEDIATLLLNIFRDNTLENIIKGTEMDKEAKRMARVNAAKKSKNTFVFGGKTIYGSLIDAACERYGWTFDYVLWGISYNNLTLLLKDKITSVYLTDEERKRVRIPDDNEEKTSGDDKAAIMKLAMESERKPN